MRLTFWPVRVVLTVVQVSVCLCFHVVRARAGKCISAVMLTLKTVKGVKTLRLAPQLHDALQKENVRVGDVVFIEANTGTRPGERELSFLLYIPP